jgi:hypothetical protein
MNLAQTERRSSPLSRLQRLAQPLPEPERCELCSAIIGEQHSHLLEIKERQLRCACEACAILFSGDEHARFRRVVNRVELLRDLDLRAELWESLPLPINLAFFYRSAQAGKVVAMYPSPGGATESLLPMDAWDELAAQSPTLQRMQSDVEALLVNCVRDRRDCFLVSIDECYKLVGLIRSTWRGFSGGDASRAIDGFFDDLRRRATRINHHSSANAGAKDRV